MNKNGEPTLQSVAFARWLVQMRIYAGAALIASLALALAPAAMATEASSTAAPLQAMFAHYKEGRYAAAIAAGEQFIVARPDHPNEDYAHFIVGTAHLAQAIASRDSGPATRSLLSARQAFAMVLKKHTESRYRGAARDRLSYVEEQLASDELANAKEKLAQGDAPGATEAAERILSQYIATSATEEARKVLLMAQRMGGVGAKPRVPAAAPLDPARERASGSADEQWDPTSAATLPRQPASPSKPPAVLQRSPARTPDAAVAQTNTPANAIFESDAQTAALESTPAVAPPVQRATPPFLAKMAELRPPPRTEPPQRTPQVPASAQSSPAAREPSPPARAAAPLASASAIISEPARPSAPALATREPPPPAGPVAALAPPAAGAPTKAATSVTPPSSLWPATAVPEAALAPQASAAGAASTSAPAGTALALAEGAKGSAAAPSDRASISPPDTPEMAGLETARPSEPRQKEVVILPPPGPPARPRAAAPVLRADAMGMWNETWLLSVNPSFYTVQLSVSADDASLREFVKANKLLGVALYRDRTGHHLVQGLYPNESTARIAGGQLAKNLELKSMAVWRIGDIQAEIRKTPSPEAVSAAP